MSDLRPLLDAARPAILRRLWRAGALRARTAAGVVGALPWLVGRGPSLGVVTRINAVALGPHPAIHDRAGTVTWADLDRRTNRLARALAAMGAGPGDRVATLLRNGREIVEVLVAAQKSGVVTCPLNTWSTDEELAPVLERADPRVVVADARHLPQLPETGTLILAVGDPLPDDRAQPYEAVLDEHSPAALPPFSRNRGAPPVILHTSGTTGRPKGAARDLAGQGVRGFAGLLEVLPVRRQDVVLVAAPLFHSFGLLMASLSAVLGAAVVLPDRFDAEASPGLVARHRATVCALTPTMLRGLLALPDVEPLRSLRMVAVSGDALPPSVRSRARERLGPVLHDLYGSTEAGWVAVATPGDMERHPGSVGRPVPGVEVAVLDDDGRPVPSGATGTIHARSDALFDGYTTGERAEGHDGSLSLGDLGHLDNDGYLYVEGRADDMVVIGGENVYPTEVEEVIRGIPGVRDVAVTGVPDDRLGRALAAFVVGTVGREGVVEACRAALASFKVPRRVELVDDLPRTATGKVRLRDLRKE